MRVPRFMATALMVLVAMPPETMADDIRLIDPDDTPGLLDIRTVEHFHPQASERRAFVHVVRTYEPWKTRILKQTQTSIVIYFDTRGDEEEERYVVIEVATKQVAPKPGLYAQLRDVEGDKNVPAGFVRVRRPDRYSVRIAIPRRRLGRGVSQYGWWIDTAFSNERYARCFARGPLASCYDTVTRLTASSG